MPAKVLIVEDEILVAANLEATVEELGYQPVGIAPDAESAFALAHARPDIALVDVNLRDGETGPRIGARLAQEHGVAVLFVTANPRRLGSGVPGTLGVMTKPCDEDALAEALDYLTRRRRGAETVPPRGITVFRASPA